MKFGFKNLKVGSLIELEIMDSQNKMVKLKTIVEEILDDSRVRIFAPISKGKAFPLRLNTSLTFIAVHKYPTVDKYDILSCRCKVVDKQMNGSISTVELIKTSDFSQIQRRNYFRLPLIKTIELSHDNKKYEMLTKDLSGNGVKGYVSTKLPAGSEGLLFLDVEEKVLELRYKIIECSPDPEHSYRYEMRASFINIKNSQLSALLKFIFSKQSEAIRKQIDLKEYGSILDTDQHYSDFFSMSNLEKFIRITPVLLWGMTLVEYAYMINAFREKNVGLNLFFGEFTRDFRPELLRISGLVGVSILVMMVFAYILNNNYNPHSRRNVNIHYLIISLLAVIAIGVTAYFV